MCRADRFLTSGERRSVEEAVAAAEKRTAAEIVCAVATESGRYDRAESFAGIGLAVVALALVNILHASSLAGAGSWEPAGGVSTMWQVLAVVAGFVAGVVLAGRWRALRAGLTSDGEMDAEVARAAAFVYASNGLTRTAGRGGILVYVSLCERRVVVLADEAVLKAAGEGFPAEMRDIAVGELRAGRRAATFLRTIEAITSKLESALPVRPGDRDELPNKLVIV